jgi:ATP-dependent DNA ligase
VKHDGFRIVARKTPESLHLWSRDGRDWLVEFAGIATAMKAWKLQSRHTVGRDEASGVG